MAFAETERSMNDMLLLFGVLLLGGEEDELFLYAGVFRKEDSGLGTGGTEV